MKKINTFSNKWDDLDDDTKMQLFGRLNECIDKLDDLEEYIDDVEYTADTNEELMRDILKDLDNIKRVLNYEQE